MLFSKALLIGAWFFVAALAQKDRIALTKFPGSSVTVGQPVDLAWNGGDGVSPVTLTLKQGDPSNLKTVAIITGDATGNTFTWTPLESIVSAKDYALQISQGVSDVNYSGQFAIVGGAASSAASAFTTTLTSTGATATATVIIAAKNTTIITPTAFTTTLGVVGTTGASGSAVAVPRNTTFMSQTLSSTSSGSSTNSASSGLVAGSATSATSTTRSSASSTSAGTSATSSAAAVAMVGAGSPLAFVLCAIGAIVALG